MSWDDDAEYWEEGYRSPRVRDACYNLCRVAAEGAPEHVINEALLEFNWVDTESRKRVIHETGALDIIIDSLRSPGLVDAAVFALHQCSRENDRALDAIVDNGALPALIKALPTLRKGSLDDAEYVFKGLSRWSPEALVEAGMIPAAIEQLSSTSGHARYLFLKTLDDLAKHAAYARMIADHGAIPLLMPLARPRSSGCPPDWAAGILEKLAKLEGSDRLFGHALRLRLLAWRRAVVIKAVSESDKAKREPHPRRDKRRASAAATAEAVDDDEEEASMAKPRRSQRLAAQQARNGASTPP
jgi:hypothetical protein